MLSAQTKEITGTVRDDSGSIPGVTVLVKGTSNGTLTNIDGEYSISAKAEDVLVFSFVGLKSQEVKVGSQSKINVTLQSEQEELDEVIVMGYTTRKKGTATGALTTLDAEVVDVPVVSFDQALQGRVAGMSVVSSSGQPGAAADVKIRGVNSISAGGSPLYIMDGIPITAGDFSALNSNDIENITVLKDASSTSIYGARAANGVIVITTKKGERGEAKVSYSGKVGFSGLAYGKWDLMNTTEKLNYEEMVGIRTPGAYDRPAIEAVDVDWRDVLYNDHAFTTSHDVTISGASEKNNYYISAGYLRQDGTAPSSGIERYSVRMNINASPKKWLNTGLNSTVGLTENMAPFYPSVTSRHNPAFSVYLMNPYYNPYNADGSVSDEEFYENYGRPNPLATAEGIIQNNNRVKVVTSGFLEFKLAQHLKFKTQLGVDGYDSRGTTKISPDLAVQNGDGSVSESFSRGYNLTMTNLATYNNTFGSLHNLNLLLGQEAISSSGDGFGASSSGFTDDRSIILGSGTTPSVSGGSVSTANFLSFFSRAEYNYNYKYYFDLSYRRDGSSRFGTNNKWANFWSAGVMWDAKKESFLAQVAPISSMQVSFNVGTSGNSSIGNYEHLAMLSTGPIYNGEQGMGVASLGNPDLTWEKVISYNFGLKTSLYNRLRLNLELYNKKTTDMLLSVPISMTSGFSAVRQNVGEMTNSGVELEVNADILSKTAFKWNLSANVGYNNNKLTSLYNGTDEYIIEGSKTKLTVGENFSAFYMVEFAGVDPENGDPLWYTKDGGITNQFSTNNAVLLDKNYIAPLSGGFTSTFSYKGVSLQAFFSWVGEKYLINNNRYYTENNSDAFASSSNQSVTMFDAWTPNNRYTSVPKYGNMMQFDSRLLENASFMRLKNLTIGWDLPKEWMYSWAGDAISRMRIYGQGQNLFTWTKYNGIDPEEASNVQIGSYPASKTFIFGIDVTF